MTTAGRLNREDSDMNDAQAAVDVAGMRDLDDDLEVDLPTIPESKGLDLLQGREEQLGGAVELDRPTAPEENSFDVLQGRYEQLCDAASKQLHDLLRGGLPTDA